MYWTFQNDRQSLILSNKRAVSAPVFSSFSGKMIRILLILLSAVACALAYPAQRKFCAVLDPSASSGASGYFGMVIDSVTGTATYGYNIDFSKFTAPAAPVDLSGGLPWHIHTYWKNMAGQNSGNIDTCISANTGGHYDPNLACGPASETAATLCSTLSRTAPLGYTYSCASAAFQGGHFGLCEVGDLSGKFGTIAYPPPNNVATRTGSSIYTDPTAAYAKDYLVANAGHTPTPTPNGLNITLPWSSIVWHASSSQRILCAVFIEDTLNNSPCYSGLAFGDIANPDAPTQATTYTSGEVATSVGVSIGLTFLGSIAVGFLLWYFDYISLNSKNRKIRANGGSKGDRAHIANEANIA